MSPHQNYRDYQMMVSIVFQYLMFYWLIQVTLPFFIKLDLSHILILIFLVYIGEICTFLFTLLSMIFLNGSPFFTLFIRFYYISDEG